MLARASSALLWLIAALTVFLGLRWVVEPQVAAGSLGMPLLDGLGRSTQIGDLSAFFFGIAAMLLLGIQTRRDSWLHAAAIFYGLAAAMRTMAYALHDAPFATNFIVIEITLCVLIMAACRGRSHTT